MRQSTVFVALRSAPIALLGLACFLLAPADRSARGADDAALKQVSAAWQKRHEGVKSFQYECALVCSLPKGSRTSIADRGNAKSHEEVPNKDAVLPGRFTFSLCGEKIAYSEEGEQWDDISNSSRIMKIRASFDTVYDRHLIEGAPYFPLGEITRGGKPCDTLTIHNNEMALWLWFSPVARLQRFRCPLEKMTVSQLHVSRDGHDCVEVSLPQSSLAWKILIYADAARDYLPLQFVHQNNGRVTYDLSIQYVRDETVGWRVSAWSDKFFSTSGAVARSSCYDVKRCSINKPLDDGVFAIEFPNGTHVIEKDRGAKTFFIVLADGKRQYIPEREYGALPRGTK